jgi:conjugal transfer mating pair stabilization protein TraG
MYIQNKRLTVNPTTYASLLHLIASVESKGNYNAYFGNATNTAIDFTNMSIAEVMAWQADAIRQGTLSNAVGRYQIIGTTLSGLVKQLGIDSNKKFDQTMQDKLAIALLERRGAEDYINKELTRDQFAANLAQEWAALPKVIGENPDKSFYASDGLNKSLVSVDAVRKAIQPISPK